MKQLVSVLLFFCVGLSYSATRSLVPMPTSVKSLKGTFTFCETTSISYSTESLQKEADILRRLLQPAMGYAFDSRKSKSNIILIQASAVDKIEAEGYQLKVTPTRIEIKAVDSGGFYYAFQTLLQLLPADIYSKKPVKREKWKVIAVLINDQPKFHWRGAMLDVSRQFYELSYLKQYISWLAAHKLNIFHIHLTDDEGWRIEIKAFPKLTEIGAWRGPNELLPPVYGSGNKRYGGYYTQEQLKELVSFAAERNVQIIPEIDLPGHSKSVAVSYPEILCFGNDTTGSAQGVKKNVWCAAREENFDMIDKIVAEVAAIFPSEYIHIGGDEVNHRVWENCTLCTDLMHRKNYDKSSRLQSLFISRVQNIITKHGKKMIGWNEILDTDSLHPETTIMVWTTPEAGKKAVLQKQPVILTTASYFYLDMAQGVNERGHKWATLLPAERLFSFEVPADSLSSIYIKGLQGNLWAEYLDQPRFQTDYQSYPRLCALAELAWAGKPTSYSNFETRLQNGHFERLYQMGVHFRVPAPIVQVKKRKLHLMNKIAHTQCYYTTDDSLSTAGWSKLNQKTKINGSLRKLHFRMTYCDSLVSAVAALAYDTVGVWNQSSLDSMQSDSILVLDLNQRFITQNPSSLLFRYRYGSSQFGIKKISIFRHSTLVFEAINDKAINLFSRNCEWELPLPQQVTAKKGNYRLEILLAGKRPTDSNGVILIMPK